MTETILQVPTRYGRGETFTIIGLLIAGTVGAVYTNYEMGAMKERGTAMRLRIEKLEVERDQMIRLQEQVKQMFDTVREIRDELKKRP
jgi:hypothetical protein